MREPHDEREWLREKRQMEILVQNAAEAAAARRAALKTTEKGRRGKKAKGRGRGGGKRSRKVAPK